MEEREIYQFSETIRQSILCRAGGVYLTWWYASIVLALAYQESVYALPACIGQHSYAVLWSGNVAFTVTKRNAHSFVTIRRNIADLQLVHSFAVLRFGLGICLCVCYSAIFTKTNRIYRIFHGCMKGNQKPAYISPKSQLLLCFGK